ncbi:RNA-binding protein [Schizosaccharomyces cryophilus OY26]|uniref:RNA-binding protein n=1 Tax=Schizosaccharomyces cryophilus (strain OY26 / ATCC MYA-4695 / CBS 11777 / NBRC 106824 / NRRL Y48691) TaxID=653667 RepID=S9XK31_SCHCR|nr:RNA-binding protein [Schizosaccharomyces cryophilus OY26]EPY54061.1 RNA-binding protein [Schizosaccharomyces cryophilus OY26]
MSFSLYEGIDSKSLDEITEESTKAKEKGNNFDQYEASTPLDIKESNPSSVKPIYSPSSLHFMPMMRRNKPNKKKQLKRPWNTAFSPTLKSNDNAPAASLNDISPSAVTPSNFPVESIEKTQSSFGLNDDTLISSFEVEKVWSELYNPLTPTNYEDYQHSEFGKALEYEWNLHITQSPSLALEARNAGLAQSSKSGIGPPPALLQDATISNPIYSDPSLSKLNQNLDSPLDLPKFKPMKNYGKHLLRKFGWNEGQGLGQSNQGILNPLQANTFNKFEDAGGHKDDS